MNRPRTPIRNAGTVSPFVLLQCECGFAYFEEHTDDALRTAWEKHIKPKLLAGTPLYFNGIQSPTDVAQWWAHHRFDLGLDATSAHAAIRVDSRRHDAESNYHAREQQRARGVSFGDELNQMDDARRRDPRGAEHWADVKQGV